MLKKITLILSLLTVIYFLFSFLIVPTPLLLEVSVDSNYRDHFLRTPALFYLQHIRGLKSYPRETHIPPLHEIVTKCSFADDPVCARALEWALSNGENVNEDDKSALGFTPLHWSAYLCDAESARILISKGASLSSQASGKKLNGKTPLEVLNFMEKTCSDSRNKETLQNLLTLKGI